MDATRILVIEDDEGARDALGCLLVEDGYTVRTADSGYAALRCASEFSPDAIVCDFYLPDLDGLQVLRRLRAAGRELFIIIVTAGGYGSGDELALRREADVFLEKPVDLGRLRDALARVTSAPERAASVLS